MELFISSEKQEIFIKTSIWNSMLEVFQSEKNIDITWYLISVQIRWKTLIVKTNKPIINTEAFIMDDKIRKLFSQKMKKLWIQFYDFEIKYL